MREERALNPAVQQLRATASKRTSLSLGPRDCRADLQLWQVGRVIVTLIMSAKLNDIDPQAWLADLLARIADTPISKLEQLLRWNGKVALC